MSKRTSKPQTWVIRNDTWLFTAYVRIDSSLERTKEWADRVLGTNFAKMTNGEVCAMTFMPKNGANFAIGFADKPGAGAVAHEALHGASHVLRKKGLGRMRISNEEAYTYLLDWLVREIGNRIW